MLKQVVLISIPVVFLAGCASTPTQYQPRVKQPLPENDYISLAQGYTFFEKCLEQGHISSNDYGRARNVIDGRVKNWGYQYLVDYNKLDATKYAMKQELDASFKQSKKNSKELREFKNNCLKLSGEVNVHYEQTNEAARQQQALLLHSLLNQEPVNQPAPRIRREPPRTTICSGSSYGFGNYGSSSALCNSF